MNDYFELGSTDIASEDGWHERYLERKRAEAELVARVRALDETDPPHAVVPDIPEDASGQWRTAHRFVKALPQGFTTPRPGTKEEDWRSGSHPFYTRATYDDQDWFVVFDPDWSYDRKNDYAVCWCPAGDEGNMSHRITTWGSGVASLTTHYRSNRPHTEDFPSIAEALHYAKGLGMFGRPRG